MCFFIVILSDLRNAFGSTETAIIQTLWIKLNHPSINQPKMVALIPDLRRAMPTVLRQKPPNRKIPVGRLLGTRKHREIQPARNGLHCFKQDFSWKSNPETWRVKFQLVIANQSRCVICNTATLKVGNCVHGQVVFGISGQIQYS